VLAADTLECPRTLIKQEMLTELGKSDVYNKNEKEPEHQNKIRSQ